MYGLKAVADNIEANWKTLAHYTDFEDTLSLTRWKTVSKVARDVLEPFLTSYRNFLDSAKQIPLRQGRVFQMACGDEALRYLTTLSMRKPFTQPKRREN